MLGLCNTRKTRGTEHARKASEVQRRQGHDEAYVYTLSRHIMFHAHVFIKALSKRVPLQKKMNVHLERWSQASLKQAAHSPHPSFCHCIRR